MIPVSGRSDVPPFQVMEIFKAATKRQATHGDLLLLCVGQPSTPAPRVVRDAVATAVETQGLGYTDPGGNTDLLAAVAAHYREAYDVEVDPDEVLISNGSSGGFSTVLLTAFEAGDLIAMTRPGYPANRSSALALGLRVVDVPVDASTRFQPTVEALESLTERPRGLVVASPGNPTGTIIDPARLAELAAWCAANEVVLLSDEIYHGISFGAPCVTARQFSADAIVLGSFSKYHSMTGWRVGWTVLPADVRARAEVLQANLSICAPSVSQVAALAALGEGARGELERHVARYARNRDLLLRRLPELGITRFAPPDGAFYAYVDVSHLTDDSRTWCFDVLDRTGVAIAPGIDFDLVEGHRFARLSFCGSTSDLDEAIDRLRAVTR